MAKCKKMVTEKIDNSVDAIKWVQLVPDIPRDVRGKEYTSECNCGGTIHAVRSTFNGHIHAKCDKCRMCMME